MGFFPFDASDYQTDESPERDTLRREDGSAAATFGPYPRGTTATTEADSAGHAGPFEPVRHRGSSLLHYFISLSFIFRSSPGTGSTMACAWRKRSTCQSAPCCHRRIAIGLGLCPR